MRISLKYQEFDVSIILIMYMYNTMSSILYIYSCYFQMQSGILRVEDCQKKRKSMRDRFVRELRKVKELKSGDPGPPYKPSWPLFELLLFLSDSVRHRP